MASNTGHRTRVAMASRLLVATSMATTLGCYVTTVRDDAGALPDTGALADAGSNADTGTIADASATDTGAPCVPTPPSERPTEVDLLLVVDNSGSMLEEQDLLASDLVQFIGALASGDRDGDGVQDFLPVESLHVGVVSTDLGSGGDSTPTCGSGRGGYDFGDDGQLLDRPHESCSGTYPSIFEFAGAAGDAEAFANEVGCVARTGISGCGFEQPLEAALKALSPATAQAWTAPGYVPPLFHGSTRGHAGPSGANAGFVRPDSVLVVVFVTDEDDCSASDPAVFAPDALPYGTRPLNTRCSDFAEEALHSIERYVRGEDGRGGLLGLRRDPRRFVFAGVVGAPPDAVLGADARPADYDTLLADMRMIERRDESGNQLDYSCEQSSVSRAYPPRRIVGVARDIVAAGGHATIQSICQPSYTAVLDAVAARVGEALEGVCPPSRWRSRLG